MLHYDHDLVDEQKSPLFRLMWAHNIDNANTRNFANNICAFHIGNGILISVAHNLRADAQTFTVISDQDFQQVIRSIAPNLVTVFNQTFILDPSTQLRHLNRQNPALVDQVIQELRRINFAVRWIDLMAHYHCRVVMVANFRNAQFYNDPNLTQKFVANMHFPEPQVQRHTFLIEVELVKAIYEKDIAIYRIINTHQDIIAKIPKIDFDASLTKEVSSQLFCLQGAPVDNFGRMLNAAQLDGILDHWNYFVDPVGGHYIMDGIRYLIKGYFRFGSSGAPYLKFDSTTKQYVAVAVQSEACPIQMDINFSRNGNFQYVNAIASPLNNVKDELERLIK